MSDFQRAVSAGFAEISEMQLANPGAWESFLECVSVQLSQSAEEGCRPGQRGPFSGNVFCTVAHPHRLYLPDDLLPLFLPMPSFVHQNRNVRSLTVPVCKKKQVVHSLREIMVF